MLLGALVIAADINSSMLALTLALSGAVFALLWIIIQMSSESSPHQMDSRVHLVLIPAIFGGWPWIIFLVILATVGAGLFLAMEFLRAVWDSTR